MLSIEQNEKLTRVGPGTPMGELLRRYWHPIAAAGELHDRPTKAVRLLGEDLVLCRDLRGRLGLIDRYCAHRRVDLSYGIPEERGLRCMYHGWMYDTTGQCVEQPFEETVHPDGRFKDKVKVKGYPVQSAYGLVWAYLGPLPAPLLPEWEPFTYDDGFVDIVISEVPCNWFQCQEISIDAVHTEWLHAYWANMQGTRAFFGRPRRHLKIGFTEFEHGFIFRRVVEGSTEEDDDWAVGRTCLWPNALFVGDTMACHFEWRVPMDDTHTLSVAWFVNRVGDGLPPPRQEHIPYRYGPLYNETGRLIYSHTINQDAVAWLGQGPITDRSLERLGEVDRGIILMRKKMEEQMAIVADGGEPISVIRDSEKNRTIKLPLHRFGSTKSQDPNARRSYLPFQAGEPPELFAEHERIVQSWSSIPTPSS